MNTIFVQEPQAATMFMSLKKKQEKFKEKVEFRLQFHATRIPQKGWDKLVVSLIPVETGRTSVKTSKATVRNGNCQWTDNVTESTKILFDSKTNIPAEKLYRLVVSMGASRSGVLGEGIINLADYLTTSSPTAVALPLKNCSFGTTLHIKIHCLVSKTISREVERQRSLDSNQEVSCSEESLECSDSQRDSHTESAKDFAGKTALGQLSLMKDNDAPVSPLCDVSSTPKSSVFSGSSRVSHSEDMSSPSSSASSSSGGHERNEGNKFVGNEELNDALSPTCNERPLATVSLKMGEMNLPGVGIGYKAIDNDRHSREESEKPPYIHDKDQSLRLKLKALKQQFPKCLMEVANLFAIAEESDSLKTVLGELKCADQAFGKKEYVHNSRRSETDDFNSYVEDPQKKTAYDKERSIELDLEHQKNQVSSKELVAVIQRLEECLEGRKKEIEEIMLRNVKLEAQIADAKCQQAEALTAAEKEWSVRLLSKEETIKALEARHKIDGDNIAELQCLNDKQGLKMTEMAELERDLKELTEENLDLIFNLQELKKELENKTVALKQLEEEQKSLVDRSYKGLNSTDGSVSPKLTLEAVNSVAHAKELSRANYDVQMDSLLIRLTETEGRHDTALRTIDSLEVESDKLNKQSLDLLQAKTAAENLVSSLQVEKEELSWKLKEAEDATALVISKVHEREIEIAQMLHQMATHSAEVKAMQLKISEIQKLNLELESSLHNSQELDRLNKSNMSDLEVQLSVIMEEMRLATLSKADLEMILAQCEMEKTAMEEALEKSLIEKRCAGHQVNGLVVKLSDLTAQLDSHIEARTELEKTVENLESKKADLENLIADLKKEKVQLMETVAGLKAQFEYEKGYEPVKVLAETYNLDHHSVQSSGDSDSQESSRAVKENCVAEKTRLYLKTQEKQLKDETAGKISTDRTLCKHLQTLKGSIIYSEKLLECLNGGDKAPVALLASLKAEPLYSTNAYNDKENSFTEELEKFGTSMNNVEYITSNADASLKEVQCQAENVINSLQCEVKRLTEALINIHSKILTSSLPANPESLDDESFQLKAARLDLQCDSMIHELILKSKSAKNVELEIASKVEELLKQVKSFQLTHIKSWVRCSDSENQFLTDNTETENPIDASIHILNPSKDFGLISAAAAELDRAFSNCKLSQSEVELSLHEFRLKFAGITKQNILLEEKVMLLESSLADMEEIKYSKQILEKKLRNLQDELDTLETIRLIEAEQRNQIKTLRAKINEFELEITDKEGKIEKLRKQVEALDRQLQQKVDELCSMQKELKEKEEHSALDVSPFTAVKEGVFLQEHVEFMKEGKQPKKKPTSKNDQKVVRPKKESTETLDINVNKKAQLRSALALEQNAHTAALQDADDIEQVVKDLVTLKRHNLALEEDLKDMQNRYLSMSLKYAEVEAKKEELSFSLRTMSNVKKDKNQVFPFRSWSIPSSWH